MLFDFNLKISIILNISTITETVLSIFFQISDFGLSRPENSCYTFGMISTRWAAPEVLKKEKTIGLRSDVWSFGVLVWEIYSLGHLPYSAILSSNLLDHILSGCRLEPPANTPSRMKALMEKCWNDDPGKRPTFGEIDVYLSGRGPNAISRNSALEPPPLPDKPQSPS